MRRDNIIIRREMPTDYAAVEHLTREAFWNVYRPGCLEHYVVHVLRQDPGFVPELDLVMERDGELVGHVLYMRSKIVADDGREIPMMTFGPISIRPGLQRQGLGKYLLDCSMERAGELGAGALCIEGNIDFYSKSGFVVAGTKGITYCPTNNTAAIFYSQSDKPNLTMEVYPIGKVTSDLSTFPDLPSRVDI